VSSKKLTQKEFENLINTRSASEELENGELGPSFLHLLATAGRSLLSKLLTEHHFKPGDIIFKEGNIGDTMFIIWSGRVAVVKGNFESPTILGYRGVGEIIGEMALLEDQPRSATVVAMEPVRTLRIKREDFEQWLSSNPSMGMGILGTLSARLRAADDARKATSRATSQLSKRITELQAEKQQIMEMEQLRQDTINLIVHDLRHPISSLFGAIKILEMVLPEEELQANRQLLDIANANCDHLQLMVESLLDVARMEADEPQLNLTSIELLPLVNDATKRTSVFTDTEDIAVHTNISADLPAIVADKEKIYRVVSNLLNNAIKYTPANGQITISAEAKDDHILMSMADTGPGIPPEDRERIFDRFAQIPGEKSRAGGFGLGLAFCKMAIEAHGGQIWVESEEGKAGTRFVFTLPMSPPWLQEDQPPAAEELS